MNQRSFMVLTSLAALRPDTCEACIAPNRLHVSHDVRIAIVQLLPGDSAVAGIVGGGDQTQIPVKLPHQRRDVTCARSDVLFRH